MQEEERNEINKMNEDSLDSDDSEMDEEVVCTTETERQNILQFKREKLQRRVSWADHLSDSELMDDSLMEFPESAEQVEIPVEEPLPVEKEMQDEAAALPVEVVSVQRANSLSRGERPKGILKKSMSQPVPPPDADALKVTFIQNLPEDEEEVPLAKAPLSESPKEIRSMKNTAVRYKIVIHE